MLRQTNSATAMITNMIRIVQSMGSSSQGLSKHTRLKKCIVATACRVRDYGSITVVPAVAAFAATARSQSLLYADRR